MSGIAFENHDTFCCIEFSRELTSMTWEQTENITRKIVELIGSSKHNNVIVTAPGFTALPDGVLGCLLRIWKSLDERTRHLVLVTDSDSLISEVSSSGMLRHWEVMKNRQAALKFLNLEGSPGADSFVSRQPSVSFESPAAGNTVPPKKEPFTFEENRYYCVIHCSPGQDRLSWSDQEAVSNAAIQRYESAQSKNLMVDLSESRYINSGGIAGLVRIWKAAQKKQGQFAVVSPNAEVTTALRASGLAKVWSITEDREEAAYGMGVSQSARVERREGNLLIGVSTSCAIIAAMALIPMFLKRESVLGVNSQLTALLLSSAAIATGFIGLLRESGWRRKLSVVTSLTSLLVLSTLWFRENPINFRRTLADFAIGRDDNGTSEKEDSSSSR